MVLWMLYCGYIVVSVRWLWWLNRLLLSIWAFQIFFYFRIASFFSFIKFSFIVPWNSYFVKFGSFSLCCSTCIYAKIMLYYMHIILNDFGFQLFQAGIKRYSVCISLFYNFKRWRKHSSSFKKITLWYRWWDSNPHGFPHDFESCASASSATSAFILNTYIY